MNSLELINKLYKPYRITKKGVTTIIESMDGKYVVKPKKEKDENSLFKYLSHCGFNHFPTIVDESRSDVLIYKYIDNIDYPKDQKAIDMIKVVASLHSKTSYRSEVREDKYKEIYNNIKSNLNYSKDEYNKLILEIEEKIFMSPSEYLFIRNSSKLMNQIAFCETKLDEWYESVKEKRETRISVIHNNLSLDHYLKGEDEALISWGNSTNDSPILDIYNFYEKEALNLEFSSILKEYFRYFDLDEDEKNLLFILLCLPHKIDFKNNELDSCMNIGKTLDYVFKTEYLVRPYYAIDNEE